MCGSIFECLFDLAPLLKKGARARKYLFEFWNQRLSVIHIYVVYLRGKKWKDISDSGCRVWKLNENVLVSWSREYERKKSRRNPKRLPLSIIVNPPFSCEGKRLGNNVQPFSQQFYKEVAARFFSTRSYFLAIGRSAVDYTFSLSYIFRCRVSVSTFLVIFQQSYDTK